MTSVEELSNLACILILLIGLRLTQRLDALAFWVFLARIAMIFLTNDVLFPVSYMPDQVGYVNCAKMRRGDAAECIVFGKNVINASWFFGFFPLPYIVSVRSVSMVNMALVIILYVYLNGNGFFSNRSRWFYFFYPSFVLYSAIGSRDLLIMFCMFMAVYNLFERKRIVLGLIWVVPLFFIKLQNAFMVLVPFAVYIISGQSRTRMIMAVVFGGAFAVFMLMFSGYLEELNTYRTSFYAEDGGMGKAPLLSSGIELPFQLLAGAIGVMLMPLPWEAGKAFQMVQSIENLFMMFLVVLYWMRRPKPGMGNVFLNLKIFFLSSVIIYGAVVFNYGTAARYRFPFMLLFILFADRLTVPKIKT